MARCAVFAVAPLASALGLVMGLALTGAAPAHADDAEGALHLDFAPRVARVGDTRGRGAHAPLEALGLALRGSYGLSDDLAAEVSLGGHYGLGADFLDQRTDTGLPADLHQNGHAAYVIAAITARLGVRIIPTLTAGVGYQHRFIPAGKLSDPETGFDLDMPVPAAGLDDLLVTFGVGLDYRFGKHWVIGLQLRATHAFSLDGVAYDAVELPITVAYYSYPEMWLRK
jgi:hypothetical protein